MVRLHALLSRWKLTLLKGMGSTYSGTYCDSLGDRGNEACMDAYCKHLAPCPISIGYLSPDFLIRSSGPIS